MVLKLLFGMMCLVLGLFFIITGVMGIGPTLYFIIFGICAIAIGVFILGSGRYDDPMHMVHGSAKALENFAKVIETSSVKKCQRCKYPFTEKERGKQYSLPKNGVYKQTMNYPDDFIHVCPLCRVELLGKDEKPFDSERYFINKIKKWRKNKVSTTNRGRNIYSRGQKGL